MALRATEDANEGIPTKRRLLTSRSFDLLKGDRIDFPADDAEDDEGKMLTYSQKLPLTFKKRNLKRGRRHRRREVGDDDDAESPPTKRRLLTSRRFGDKRGDRVDFPEEDEEGDEGRRLALTYQRPSRKRKKPLEWMTDMEEEEVSAKRSKKTASRAAKRGSEDGASKKRTRRGKKRGEKASSSGPKSKRAKTRVSSSAKRARLGSSDDDSDNYALW